MIHPKHYQELLESAIALEIIDLNFQSLSGDAATLAIKSTNYFKSSRI
jgi:hypothetical protein